jgi:hypothetical protein
MRSSLSEASLLEFESVSYEPELLESLVLVGCAVTYGEIAGSADSVASGINTVIVDVDATGW